MSLAGKRVHVLEERVVLEERAPDVLAGLVTPAGGVPVCGPAVVERMLRALEHCFGRPAVP